MKFFNAASKKRLTLRLASPYIDAIEEMRATQSRRLATPNRIVGSFGSSGASKSGSGARGPPRESLRDTIIASRVSKKSLKQAQLLSIGDKESLKLMTQINSYLLDRSHEEAKVLKSFVDNFDSLEKNIKTCPENTRNFLTSLKERIMDTRYSQLAEMAPPFNSAIETEEDVVGREVELCIEKATLLKLHDRIMDVLHKQYKKDDLRIDQQIDGLRAKSQSYFGIPPGLEATSRWQVAVIELNEIGTLFLPQEKLRAILNCIAAIVDTAQFESDRRARDAASRAAAKRTSSLIHDSQGSSSPVSLSPHSTGSRGSISPRSPKNGSASVSPPTSGSAPTASTESCSPGTTSTSADISGEAPCVASLSIPSISAPEPTQTTANAANASSVPTSTSPTPTSTTSKPVDLSADDLLPILIYVVVHSKLGRLESQCQYMWQMSDPADLVGEAGYYLTMLSSAIEYLKQHEEEVAPPASSEPVRITGTSAGAHLVQLFDSDSDSDDGMLDMLPMASPASPSSSSSSANSTWMANASPPPLSSTPSTWIGPKSYPIDPTSGTISAIPTVGSPTGVPGSPSTYARNTRQSMLVIGNKRGSGILSSGHRSGMTQSTGSTDDSHESPPALSASTSSISEPPSLSNSCATDNSAPNTIQ